MSHRILFVEHSTDGTIGGSHLCLLEICRFINKARYQPVVCFFEKNSLIEEFEATGAEVILLDLPKNWLCPSYVPNFFAKFLGFGVNLVRTLVIRSAVWVSKLQQWEINLVHINNACGYDHDLMLASIVAGRACVVHERGIQTSINWRTRFFAGRVNKIIAISDAVEANLVKGGISPEQITRIDDGIDENRLIQIESVQSIQRRLGIPADTPVIGIVGNIKHWKGQHVVIEALAGLVKDFPDVKCLFVGTIADESYCQGLIDRAKKLRIPDTAMIFTGYESHPSDLMRVMDLVIHASVDPEPFGIVLLEAMGAARPLIATNQGGPVEIINSPDTGLLVSPNDPDELLGAITFLLSNKVLARQMGQRGRERYLERYTIEDNLRMLEKLYSEVL